MKNKNLDELAMQLVEEFQKKQSAGVLANLNKRNFSELDVSREKILADIREKLSQYQDENGNDMTEEQKDEVIDIVKKEMWGYGVIDSLVQDPDISDIKLYNSKNVRVKRNGQREASGISFVSEAKFKSYVTKLLERNKINLGTANAIQTFTDTSQEGFILRITIISGLLTDTGYPLVAIRKIPKDKYTIGTLGKAGMFDETRERKSKDKKKSNYRFFRPGYEDFNDLMDRLISSKGIIFTGKGASGKTTLMNAMIAEIPDDESVMICQENAELFDHDHPDLFGCHVLTNGGDSKVSYNLGDLTRAALLVDLDRVIVGEVKEGSEAAGLSKASMTGHKCWTSVHGENCVMAVDKLADYISQATGYSTRDSLKQLTGFEYVIHMKNFSVNEIVRIGGWDKEKECLIYENIYPFPERTKR